MLGLCEQCIGDSLNSRQKSIIDRCVRKLYIDIARSKEKYIPVMSDFYDILMAQPEEEAKDIALSLKIKFYLCIESDKFQFHVAFNN